MKILNFGSLNIDHSYRVSHIVAPGETIAASGLSLQAGGKGLNQSIALAKSGADVYHAGCIGTDGNFLKEMLEEAGVNTDHLRTVDCVNGHAVIQVNEQGQNSIVIFGGSNREVSREQVDAVLQNFSSQDLVLIQNEISCTAYIAEKCLASGIPLAFNPSPMSPDLVHSFPLEAVSYLLVNEGEAFDLTGCSQPDQAVSHLLSRFPKMKIVITLGSKGAIYADKTTSLFQPSFPVQAVDTTGAGDTFTGFFLGLLAQETACPQALRYACAAAALSVTQPGAAPAIPGRSAVEEFLRRRAG